MISESSRAISSGATLIFQRGAAHRCEHRQAAGVVELERLPASAARLRAPGLAKSSRFGHDAAQIRLSKRFAQKRKSPAISRATCHSEIFQTYQSPIQTKRDGSKIEC